MIADIGLPPRNDEGLVEDTAEVVILRPAGGGNGMLLELSTCGRKLMLMLSNDALEALAQRLEARIRAVAGRFAPDWDLQLFWRSTPKRTHAYGLLRLDDGGFEFFGF